MALVTWQDVIDQIRPDGVVEMVNEEYFRFSFRFHFKTYIFINTVSILFLYTV